MLLYHGSNLVISKPRIIESRRFLDFGAGFYLTSDFEQAKKWAIRTKERTNEGDSLVSVFEVEDSGISKLNLLVFKTADVNWLKYVAKNRTEYFSDNYDIVYGPVANDQTMRVISNYIKGYYNEKIALELLLPQKLKDQYVFKNERALSILKFKEAIIV